MREIRAEIDINAPPDRVWRVLTDFGSFAAWNPLIHAVVGRLEPGARLRVSVRLPLGMKLWFKTTVINCEPNRELTWGEQIVRPGLFGAHHSFVIRPLDERRVRFVQTERLMGPLASFPVGLGVLRSMQVGFNHMNHALKARAEGAASPWP